MYLYRSLSVLMFLAVLAGGVFAEPPADVSRVVPSNGRSDTTGPGTIQVADNAVQADSPTQRTGDTGMMAGGQHGAMSGPMMLVCAAFGLLIAVALLLFVVLEVVWIRVGRQQLRHGTAPA
jgi:hypothetical protein